MSPDEEQEDDLALLVEIVRRGQAVQNDTTTPPEEKRRLISEIVELGRQAKEGHVPRENWETHELNWTAYCSNLRRNLVRQLAQLLIQCERTSDSASPARTAELNQEMRQILYWWQHEGGREQFLSELPIEERKALERARI